MFGILILGYVVARNFLAQGLGEAAPKICFPSNLAQVPLYFTWFEGMLLAKTRARESQF